MLSLSQLTPRQAMHYYQVDNYYTTGNLIENSAWFGRGAEALGLSGHVDKQSFDALINGMAPNGKTLVGTEKKYQKTKERARVHRAGIDLTFSAPKSVSLKALIEENEAILNAHKEAVTETLRIVEDRYLQRRKGKEHTVERTQNALVAQFHHDTSRAEDPQIHTHCVILNATRIEDGSWRAIHTDPYFKNAKLIGLIYQNALAVRMRQLGYEIEIKPTGTFELNGYSQEQLKAFSKRRKQLQDLGVENQKDARTLVYKNREKKRESLDRNELLRRWQGEALEQGLSHPNPAERSLVQSIEGGIAQKTADARVLSAIKSNSERDVSFARSELEKSSLESGLGTTDWTRLQNAIVRAEKNGLIIPHGEGQFVTQEGLNREHAIIRKVAQGKSKFEPVMTINNDHDEELFGPGIKVTKGQREAIRLTLTTRDQFIAWQGVAGAGKTFAMKLIKELAEKRGYSLKGFAPSADAAKVLTEESRIESDTLASLLVKRESAVRKTNSREIWIVDEAGLMSSVESEKLLERASRAKVRVVFVGDTRQLSAVSAGNPLKLMQENGISTAHLSESMRQKDSPQLKLAVDAVADGKIRQGLLAVKDRIVEQKNEKKRVKCVASEFLALSADEREKTLVLAGSNRERQLITQEIRAGLKKEGILKETTAILILKAVHLTEEEKVHAQRHEVGNVLVFSKGSRLQHISKIVQYRILSVDTERNQISMQSVDSERVVTFNPRHVATFNAYRVESIEVAIGEKVRWTKNLRPLGLRNGEDLIVQDISDRSISLTRKNGETFEIERCSPLQLDYNYVNTVFSSQGKTCRRVIISTDHTFGREATYVAISRAKFDLSIYAENAERFLMNAEKSRANKNAVDFKVQSLSEGGVGLLDDEQHTPTREAIPQKIETKKILQWVGNRLLSWFSLEGEKPHQKHSSKEQMKGEISMSEQVEKTPSEMKSRKPTRDDLALKSQQAMSELLEKLNLKPDRNELGVLYNFGKSNFEIVGKMFDNNLNKALGISRKNRKSLSDAQVVAGIEMIGKTSEKTMGEIVAKNGHDFAFRLPDSLRRDIGQTRASQSRALEHSQGQEQSI